VSKNVILTEDTKSGYKFYQLLKDSGIFRHTVIMSTDYDKSGGGGYSKTFAAYKHYVKNKEIVRGDTVYLAIDVLYALTDRMKKDVVVRNKQVEDVAAHAKKAGIECVPLILDCWEVLILSFKHLLALCNSVGTVDTAAETTYRMLESNGVFRNKCERKFEIYSKVFNTKISCGLTIEECFEELLRMITAQSGQHACFAMSKTGVIGQCWTLDCVDAINGAYCGTCYFVPPQNKITDGVLYVGRIHYLANNSLICKVFADCM